MITVTASSTTIILMWREAKDRVSPADRDSRAFEASKDLILTTATAERLLLEDDPDVDPTPLRVLQRLQDDVVADDVDLQVDRAPRRPDLVEERSAAVPRLDEDPGDGERRRFARSRDVGNRRWRRWRGGGALARPQRRAGRHQHNGQERDRPPEPSAARVFRSGSIAGSVMSQMLLAWDEAHRRDRGARRAQTPARCRQD